MSLQDRADVVVAADAHAAGGHHQVSLTCRIHQGRFDRSLLVQLARQDQRLAAGLGDGRGQCDPICVVDLAGAERLAGPDELVAGRQDRDHGPAAHRDVADAKGRQHRDLRRRQRTGQADLVAGPRVVRRGADVVRADARPPESTLSRLPP